MIGFNDMPPFKIVRHTTFAQYHLYDIRRETARKIFCSGQGEKSEKCTGFCRIRPEFIKHLKPAFRQNSAAEGRPVAYGKIGLRFEQRIRLEAGARGAHRVPHLGRKLFGPDEPGKVFAKRFWKKSRLKKRDRMLRGLHLSQWLRERGFPAPRIVLDVSGQPLCAA
jgi:hypothetical protein